MKALHIILASVGLSLLCSFVELPVSTGDFKVDGVSYEVNNRRQGQEIVPTVTVCSGSLIPGTGQLVIPEKIDFGGTVYTVGRIDFDAFKGRTDLKEIVLPESVTNIFSCAFDGCVNLGSINIPEGVDMIDIWCFRNCKKLRDLTLPASVGKIEHGAFDGCGLRTLTLGEGLGVFDSYEAFAGSHNGLNLDRLTVTAPRCQLKDVRAKLLVFKGKMFTLSSNFRGKQQNTMISEMVLENVDAPFPLWDKGIAQDFAAKCTVYVPDRLVNDFRSDADWSRFKEIKPLSACKL